MCYACQCSAKSKLLLDNAKSKIHHKNSNLKGGGESKVSLGGVEGAESGRAADYEVAGGGGEGSGARVEGVHLEAELEGTRPSVKEVPAGDGLAHLKQEQSPSRVQISGFVNYAGKINQAYLESLKAQPRRELNS